MNKFFVGMISFWLLFSVAMADVMPYYMNSLKRYGIGYTSVSSPLIMRREAKSDGEILETFTFDFKGNATCEKNKDRCTIDEAFSAYSAKNKIALMTTLDESEDWNLVCFNQLEMPVCGWVETNKNKFYNWSDFFNIYGKKFGLYLFKDIKKADKILYSAPFKETNAVGSIEMPRMISTWLVRGNWLLVKVYDFNNQQKTGWINFRENNKLKLFVKF